jgi:anhydro-N-acetylmuramic acid kinase
MAELFIGLMSGTSMDAIDASAIDPDWVEAAAFAWLARQQLAGRPGNIPEVTGARHPVVLGCLSPARSG